MVTKKTRLLSAFAAVLMLVSLFTCFVLPAAAEVTLAENPPVAWPEGWPENMIAYKDRTTSSTATNYAITDARDWLAAAADSNDMTSGPLKGNAGRVTFDGITLWLTNDIDFSGVALESDPTLFLLNKYYKSTSTTETRFQGTINGQGYSFKNLNIDLSYTITNGNYLALGLIANGYGALIRDLTVDASCSFKYETDMYSNTAKTTPIECQCGVFMGLGTDCTFINCRNEADLEYTNSGNPKKASSISTFGRQTGTLKMINCANMGALKNNDDARATGLAEWLSNSATFYNCYNIGSLSTVYEGDYDYVGLVSTSASNSTLTGIILDNTYNVGESIECGSRSMDVLATKGTALEAGAATTGELAYLLNKNWVDTYDAEYGRTYYTVKDGKTVVGTEAEQPVKLDFTFGKTTETVYAVPDADGNVDLAKVYSFPAPTYTVEDGVVESAILKVTPGSEVEAVVTSEKIVDCFLQKKLDWFAGETIAYYTNAEGMELTSDVLTAMQNGIDQKTYETQEAVDADLDALNGYTFNPESIVPISDYEKYGESLHYSVSTKEEYDYLCGIKSRFTTEHTIHFLDNIDMGGSAESLNSRLTGFMANIDGHNNTISNLWFEGAWLGSYAGSSVKDLTFKDGGYTYAGNAAYLIATVDHPVTLSNITLDNVTGTCTPPLDEDGDPAGGRQAMLVTTVSGENAKLVLRDITIVNCTMNRPADKGDEDVDIYWNSGLVLGKTYDGSIDADGIYLNNNTLTGKRVGSGLSVAFGEIICDATIKNVGIFNTTVDGGDKYVGGVLSASTKWGVSSTVYKTDNDGNVLLDDNGKKIVDHYVPYVASPEVTFENVIAANNTESKNFIVTDDYYPISINISNVYTDVTKIVSDEYGAGTEEKQTESVSYTGIEKSNTNAEAAAEIASGKAAYELNSSVDQKWAMDGTLPIFDTEATAEPIQIGFDMAVDYVLYKTYYLYTDKDGKLIADEAFKVLADWSVTDWDQVYTESCTYNGTHVHDWSEDTDPATCTQDGKTTYTCACGDSYETILEAGHLWSEWTHNVTTSGDASEHTHECTREGCDEVESEPCNYGDPVTVPATKEEVGTITRTCSDCKYGDVVTLPKLVYVELEADPVVKGKSVEVQVNLKNNPGIAGMTVTFSYNSDVFTLKNVVQGDLIANGVEFSSAIKDDGTVTKKISFAGTKNITESGTLAVLTFEVNENATVGDYAFTVTAAAANEEIEHVTVTEHTSTIKVVDYIRGDINGDRFVTIADAVLLLRHVSDLKIDYTVNPDAADLCVDGEVDVNDVVYLLQYLNGWYETL